MSRQPLVLVLVLVLVLEDMHRAGPASIDLRRVLAREADALPLLMAVTYRADEVGRDNPLSRALPALAWETSVERIDLRRRADAVIADLVGDRYAPRAPTSLTAPPGAGVASPTIDAGWSNTERRPVCYAATLPARPHLHKKARSPP